MKKILLALIILCFACKKSSDNKAAIIVKSGPSVYYDASANTSGFSSALTPYHIDSTNGSAQCLYVTASSSYLFEFNQNTWGVLFQIPSAQYPNFQFPLNTALNFNLDSAHYWDLTSTSEISFSQNQSIAQCDSINITLTITRKSDSTIDGTFSGIFYIGNPFGSGTITNGTFKNLPLKSN